MEIDNAHKQQQSPSKEEEKMIKAKQAIISLATQQPTASALVISSAAVSNEVEEDVIAEIKMLLKDEFDEKDEIVQTFLLFEQQIYNSSNSNRVNQDERVKHIFKYFKQQVQDTKQVMNELNKPFGLLFYPIVKSEKDDQMKEGVILGAYRDDFNKCIEELIAIIGVRSRAIESHKLMLSKINDDGQNGKDDIGGWLMKNEQDINAMQEQIKNAETEMNRMVEGITNELGESNESNHIVLFLNKMNEDKMKEMMQQWQHQKNTKIEFERNISTMKSDHEWMLKLKSFVDAKRNVMRKRCSNIYKTINQKQKEMNKEFATGMVNGMTLMKELFRKLDDKVSKCSEVWNKQITDANDTIAALANTAGSQELIDKSKMNITKAEAAINENTKYEMEAVDKFEELFKLWKPIHESGELKNVELQQILMSFQKETKVQSVANRVKSLLNQLSDDLVSDDEDDEKEEEKQISLENVNENKDDDQHASKRMKLDNNDGGEDNIKEQGSQSWSLVGWLFGRGG